MAALCLVGCLGGNVGRTQKVYDGEQRRVVIVGGGFAAVHMCEELAKHPHNIKVTMICPNDHLDIAWASPRAIARPETANRNVIPLHKIFQRSKHAHDMVTHVHDTVAWVTETYVETAMSCERHEYDVLVIGTGATYAEGSEAKRLKSNHSSIGGADRVKELRELAERVKGSKGVMVVGAGPTGIELAAELGAAYPHVPIKLVTNKYEVGAGMPKPVKAALQAAFQSRPNVSFVTGERGSILDSKRHGCDVVFMCAGMEPNTSFLGGGALKASLDEKGFIKTGATGRVLVRSFGFNSRMDSVWGIRLTTSCSTLNSYYTGLCQRLCPGGLRQDVRGLRRDGDDERAVPARARHREVRSSRVRPERAAVPGRAGAGGQGGEGSQVVARGRGFESRPGYGERVRVSRGGDLVVTRG